jgi:DNA-binding transcriptional LysR family regulator
MDRIDLFRIYARVVDCASFTRAADQLGLPRSTVSAAVRELEDRLGTRLLHRTTRRVAPTPDGEAFHARCLRLVADVEEVEGLFRQGPEQLAGRLRVDLPGRIGRLVVAPALPEFLARHPALELELGVGDRPIDLVEAGVDCALRVGPLGDSGLVARPLGELPLVNVASAGYLQRHGTPASPHALEGHFVVRYASPGSGRVEPWEWIEDGQVHGCTPPAQVTVNSAEAYLACCLAGLGMIQVPAYDVRDALRAGTLVEVMPRWRAAALPMTLLYPHRRHLSRRVRVFADWLEALLRRDVLAAPAPAVAAGAG